MTEPHDSQPDDSQPHDSTAHESPASPAGAAGTWTLGDRTVRRIGFGTMRLPGAQAFSHGPPRDRATSLRVLREAVDLGVNHVDTAAFYFSSVRSANELLNSALSPYPDDLTIVTKVGPGRDAGGEFLDWARPDQLRGQVEENLRQLGRDHLDVVNLRTYSQRASIADHVGALVELREAGLLRHVGLSNVGLDQLAEAQAITPVVCVQNRYGLTTREGGDEVLDACGRQGIAFVPFFAVAGAGRERGATEPESEQVLSIAARHGVTAAQLRIAWTLHRGPHVLAIPGTGDPDHLRENVAAGAVRLTEDDLARLDDLPGAG